MKSTLQLSIENPCQEDWEAMTPQARGRFCASCTKVVTDFSSMTDSQILEYLKGINGNSCGRFTREQLNRPLIPAMVHKNNVWRRAFVAVAVMFIALPRLISKPSQALQKGNMKVKIQSQLKPVTGQILDAATKKPIAGVAVKLVENLSQTYSDSLGRFTIMADRNDTAKLIKLLFEKEGYAPVEYNSESGKIEGDVMIEMDVREYKKAIELISNKTTVTSGKLLDIGGRFVITKRGLVKKIPAELRVSVKDAKGDPLVGVKIQILLKDSEVLNADTDSEGLFEFQNLIPNNHYTVRAISAGYSSVTMNDIVLSAGINDILNIVLTDRSYMLGVIISSKNKVINMNSNEKRIENPGDKPHIGD